MTNLNWKKLRRILYPTKAELAEDLGVKEEKEECSCLKCGDRVWCEHNKNEPHEETMCGSCAQ